jgi:DNA-binding transcriptional LysR family regulator
MINLNQLRAFYSVVKTGTFSKAAEELFVTEPAVLAQVRSLERSLGFKLLDKFGKDLMPSDTGKLLYEHAEKIFRLVDDTEKAMKAVRDLRSGTLRAGAAGSLARYVMPIIISAFREHHPKMQVHLDSASSSELVRGIVACEYELALVARVAYPEKIESFPISKDEILLVGAPQNQFTSRAKCTLQELDGCPMICRDIRSATRQAIWKEFGRREVMPSAIIETGNTEFIKDLVGKGKGFSFLAKICVQEELTKGELSVIPLEEGPFFMDIDVIHLKGKSFSPAATMFLHFLRQISTARDLCHFVDEMKEKRLAV